MKTFKTISVGQLQKEEEDPYVSVQVPLMPYLVGILWRQPTPAHVQGHLHAIPCAGPSLHLASVSVLH